MEAIGTSMRVGTQGGVSFPVETDLSPTGVPVVGFWLDDGWTGLLIKSARPLRGEDPERIYSSTFHSIGGCLDQAALNAFNGDEVLVVSRGVPKGRLVFVPEPTDG